MENEWRHCMENFIIIIIYEYRFAEWNLILYESLLNIEAVWSYLIGSSFQNASNLFLNVFLVSACTTLLDRLFQSFDVRK